MSKIQIKLKKSFSVFKKFFSSALKSVEKVTSIALVWALIIVFSSKFFLGKTLAIVDAFIWLLILIFIPIFISNFKGARLKHIFFSLFKRLTLIVILEVLVIGILYILSCFYFQTKALECTGVGVFENLLLVILFQFLITLFLVSQRKLSQIKTNSKLIYLLNLSKKFFNKINQPYVVLGSVILLLVLIYISPNIVLGQTKVVPIPGTNLSITYKQKDLFPIFNFSKWEEFEDTDQGFIWQKSLSRISNRPQERVILQVGLINETSQPLKIRVAQLFSPGSDLRVSTLINKSENKTVASNELLNLVKDVFANSEIQYEIESQILGENTWQVIHFFEEESNEIVVYNRWYLGEIDSKLVLIRILSLSYDLKAFGELEEMVLSIK